MLRLVVSLALAVSVSVAVPQYYGGYAIAGYPYAARPIQQYAYAAPAAVAIANNGIPGTNGQTGPPVIPGIQLPPVLNDVQNKGLELTRPLIEKVEAILNQLWASSSSQGRADLSKSARLLIPMQKNLMIRLKQWRDNVKAQGRNGIENLFNVVAPVYVKEMIRKGTRPLAFSVYDVNIPVSNPRSLFHELYLRSDPTFRAAMEQARLDMKSMINAVFEAGYDSWNSISIPEQQFLIRQYNEVIEGLINQVTEVSKAFLLGLSPADLDAILDTFVYQDITFDGGVFGAEALERIANGQLPQTGLPTRLIELLKPIPQLSANVYAG